jgi:tartrate dehydrogenase/decarboxylase/D-malate dehydrogenase
MNKHRIAVIPGDGIGPEVIAEGVKVLEKIAELDKRITFEFSYFPWGCEFYSKHGRMMDEDGLEQLKEFEAIYLGAVGYPGVPDHISLWELLLKIRKGFDQYVNIRPITLLQGAPCPLKDVKRDELDMLVIRGTARASTRAPKTGCSKANRMRSYCRAACFRVRVRSGSSVTHSKLREGLAVRSPA